MKLLGLLLIFIMLQLFVFGAIIQRGKDIFIPDLLKEGITDMPMYCKMFGNRFLLLGLFTMISAWQAFEATTVSYIPIIIFGLGIILTIILMIMDHKKYSR